MISQQGLNYIIILILREMKKGKYSELVTFIGKHYNEYCNKDLVSIGLYLNNKFEYENVR